MFETSFNIDVKNRDYLDFLYDGLKDTIKKINGIVVCQIFDDRYFLTLACEYFFAAEIISEIDDLLAEIFVLGFKKEYLKKRLYIYKENLLSKMLVDTMTIFDSENDKKLVKKELFNQQVCALDGFFNFRLKKTKQKWDEIIDLANENCIVLSDKNVCEEFLAFLIEAMPKSQVNLKIDCDETGINFFDGQKKFLPVLPFGKKEVDEEAVLFDILRISPKSVFVQNKSIFSDEFLYIIKRYF